MSTINPNDHNNNNNANNDYSDDDNKDDDDWDNSINDYYYRIRLEVTDVTTTQFNVKIIAWYDTIIHGAGVNWIATATYA